MNCENDTIKKLKDKRNQVGPISNSIGRKAKHQKGKNAILERYHFLRHSRIDDNLQAAYMVAAHCR